MKSECPEEEKFADYLEGRLSEDERGRLESHLSDCESCMEEVFWAKDMLLNDVLKEFKPVPDAVTRQAMNMLTDRASILPRTLKDTIVRSLKNLHTWVVDFKDLKLYSNNQLAPVRSSEKATQPDIFRTTKSFEDIETEIEIEKSADNKAVVRVQMVKDVSKQYDVRVTLLNAAEREVASFLLNGGFVIFENLPFDRYSLVFVREMKMIGIYKFEIKESQHGRGRRQEEGSASRRNGKGPAGA